MIATEICAQLYDIMEIAQSNDEGRRKEAETAVLAITQHFVGGYLELLDMAHAQSKSMERIATAFERIATAMEKK
jgi:hypothetical protein